MGKYRYNRTTIQGYYRTNLPGKVFPELQQQLNRKALMRLALLSLYVNVTNLFFSILKLSLLKRLVRIEILSEFNLS